MEHRLREAWADHVGLDVEDERVEHGWPRDFAEFKAGWDAALPPKDIEERWVELYAAFEAFYAELMRSDDVGWEFKCDLREAFYAGYAYAIDAKGNA